MTHMIYDLPPYTCCSFFAPTNNSISFALLGIWTVIPVSLAGISYIPMLSQVLLFYGINKYATTHISDWNFKVSLSSDISTFEMDFIFWTNPVFSFVCLDTIIAKPTSAIFELLSVE